METVGGLEFSFMAPSPWSMAFLGPQPKTQIISDRPVVTPIWQLQQGFSLGKCR